jgi:hypothetical protein
MEICTALAEVMWLQGIPQHSFLWAHVFGAPGHSNAILRYALVWYSGYDARILGEPPSGIRGRQLPLVDAPMGVSRRLRGGCGNGISQRGTVGELVVVRLVLADKA